MAAGGRTETVAGGRAETVAGGRAEMAAGGRAEMVAHNLSRECRSLSVAICVAIFRALPAPALRRFAYQRSPPPPLRRLAGEHVIAFTILAPRLTTSDYS